MNKKKFSFVLKHRGINGCGKDAFYLTKNKFEIGETILARDVCWLNNEIAQPFDLIKCDSCGKPVDLKLKYIERRSND